MMANVLRWTTPASFLTLATGMVLFLGEPQHFLANPFFRIKLIALILAVGNLAVFHASVYSRVEEWDDDSSPPFAARAFAALSLALWAIVLIASRLVAYNWFG